MNSRARYTYRATPQQALGQIFQQPAYGYNPYGVSLDPTLEVALATTGEILKRGGDAGADQSMQLIRRIIIAPGFGVSAPQPGEKRYLSSLNPVLANAANFMEHSWAYAIAALAIPVVAYLVGKKQGAKQAGGSYSGAEVEPVSGEPELLYASK